MNKASYSSLIPHPLSLRPFFDGLDEFPEAILKAELVAVRVTADYDFKFVRAARLDARPDSLVREEEDRGQRRGQQYEARVDHARAGVFLHGEDVRVADALEVRELKLVS